MKERTGKAISVLTPILSNNGVERLSMPTWYASVFGPTLWQTNRETGFTAAVSHIVPAIARSPRKRLAIAVFSPYTTSDFAVECGSGESREDIETSAKVHIQYTPISRSVACATGRGEK